MRDAASWEGIIPNMLPFNGYEMMAIAVHGGAVYLMRE
jgi:hypothetical protein